MVAIVIITIIIIFVIVIKDFTAWLEGYVNRSFYMGKCVPSEQHFFQKEDKQAGFSPYPCVLGQDGTFLRASILAYVIWANMCWLPRTPCR